MPTLTHSFAPKGGAARLFKSRAGEVLLGGAAGTGKSRACLEKLHYMALLTPGMRGLIVRKTAISLASSALVTFERDVINCALIDGTVTWFGGSGREPAQYRYTNGSVIAVGGMDKADKIMSTEYDVIYVQEATELTADDWEKATTRLRNGRMTFQQLLADCNPSHPTHFLKQRSERGDLLLIESRHEDNPRYVNPDGSYTSEGQAYLEKLDKLTGVRKLRLRDGMWAAAEGVIWEEFDPASHVVDALPPGSEIWSRYWAIDFGYTNPFVLQCWAEDPDGRLWMYREIYHTGLKVEDAARQILDIVAPYDRWGERAWVEPRPQAIITDHDAEDRATFEAHVGIGTTAAIKSVSPGLQAVGTRMRRAADGKPRLFLVKGATVQLDSSLIERRLPTSTIAEIPGYIWDTGKEKPLKVNDHGCDTTRYVVMYLDNQSNFNFRRL